MTLKTKHEKRIAHNIIIIPIVFLVVFMIVSFVMLDRYFIPKNGDIWEQKTREEYYKNQKKIIQEEVIKIYNLISDEREELNTFLKSHLKQQNNIFTATVKQGVTYNLTDTNLNFKVIPISELERTNKDLFFKAHEVGKDGPIIWEENDVTYQGHFRFCEKNFYITYVDRNKQSELDKKSILRKIMNLRYPSENYIFAFGVNGVVYGHFKESILEKDNLKEIDKKRYENLIQITNFAKEKTEGFIQYKTGTKKYPEIFEDKISYIVYDKEWDLVIGFGLTKNEIDNKIKVEEEFKDKLLRDILLNIIFITIIYMLIHIFMMYFFGNKATKMFLSYKDMVTAEKERIIRSVETLNNSANLFSSSVVTLRCPFSILLIFVLSKPRFIFSASSACVQLNCSRRLIILYFNLSLLSISLLPPFVAFNAT